LRDEVTPVAQLLNIPTKTSWRVPGFGKRQEPVLAPEPLPPPTLPAAPTRAPSFAKTLADAAPAAALAAPVSAAASPLSATDASREPGLHDLVADSADAPTEEDLFKRPQRGFSWGWVFVLVLLSAAVFAAMYQDLVLKEVEQFKKYLLRGTPAVAAPAEEAASGAAAIQAASEAAASAAQSVASSAAAVASASDAMPASVALDPKESLIGTSSPLPVQAVAPAVVTSASVDTNSAKPNGKEADTKSDEAWVNQLPANGYVLQLAAFDTEEETQAFKRAQSAYAKARVLRVYKKDSNKRYFILVAGPWTSKAEADAFMQSNPVLAKGWLRSAKSLKAQFTKP
jgi:septal ring-binding cell division protein DamX